MTSGDDMPTRLKRIGRTSMPVRRGRKNQAYTGYGGLIKLRAQLYYTGNWVCSIAGMLTKGFKAPCGTWIHQLQTGIARLSVGSDDLWI